MNLFNFVANLVEALINKWMHLESEFAHKADVIASVGRTAEAFMKAKHYMADDIVKRVEGIKSRYECLSEPLHIRRENLDETFKFYELLRDVDEEVTWVEERLPAVGVDADLGGYTPFRLLFLCARDRSNSSMILTKLDKY